MTERLKKLGMSFVYAFRGIAFTVRHERNMRIHIIATIYVLYFSTYYELTKSELILLVMTCMLVMAFEMLNTAIEVVIDKVSPNYSPLAKIGKDVAAGAVFLSAVMAVIVGLILFGDVERICFILQHIFTNLNSIAILFASMTVSFLFIRSARKRKVKGKTIK